MSPAVQDFRKEAREWFHDNVPKVGRPTTHGPEIREFDAAWMARQHEAGWAGIDWPAEYGGRSASLVEQVIWYEELVRAHAPGPGVFDVAISHAGPTLISRGTPEQKAEYLPRILRGETPWCQGFSEPGSGSDLASLSTRGVIDGDELVITGQKIWTSNGQWSDYCELLVRTDPSAPKHSGISWVVMDMHLRGIDVRPITSINGFPHNCEVFYDEVRVPITHVVGGLNNGWSVAMTTLASERGPGFLDLRLRQITLVDDLIEYARESGKLADDALAERLAEARASASALRAIAYYQASTIKEGEMPPIDSVSTRAFAVQLEVQIGHLAMDVLGQRALEFQPWVSAWLYALHAPIGGGTIDIQKNIIGERVLGLPR